MRDGTCRGNYGAMGSHELRVEVVEWRNEDDSKQTTGERSVVAKTDWPGCQAAPLSYYVVRDMHSEKLTQMVLCKTGTPCDDKLLHLDRFLWHSTHNIQQCCKIDADIGISRASVVCAIVCYT
jgi:hypothetical protein